MNDTDRSQRRRAAQGRRSSGRRAATSIVGVILVAMSMLVMATTPAVATAYVPVYGEGSSWSANAIDQWISDVQPDGMRVQYIANGSTTGREQFMAGQTDFAASDIPFQTNPDDGSAPETPHANSYAYMPITAGGTVFMYNLKIDGQQVTNLRLSGENIAKIFTGEINNWDNPALAAENPALKLPDQSIVPVVRSDGAGSSYELSEWMIKEYPSVWNSFCSASGRAPSCGATSFFPTLPGSGMVAQSGDLGVAGYVSQSYADGSIGYVEYSYALNDHFPVVQMLNAAGYYTEPSAQNVAVSLLSAKVDTTDVHNPAKYLTEDLTGVYTDPDSRTYPLSSYSYLILPTKIQGQFDKAEGTTLAAFSYYAMCQGQQQSASLGYSPMPINLVEAAFDQIEKIPGAQDQSINIQSCNNPTFTPSGANLLAQTAPYPPACDKAGPTQCTTGTGGATKVITVVSSGNPASNGSPGAGSGGSGGSGGAGTGSGSTGAGESGSTGGGGTGGGANSGAGAAATSHARAAAVRSCLSRHPHDKAYCAKEAAASIAPVAGTDPGPATNTLAVTTGWSIEQSLIVLVALALIAVILVPGGVLSRRRRRRAQ